MFKKKNNFFPYFIIIIIIALPIILGIIKYSETADNAITTEVNTQTTVYDHNSIINNFANENNLQRDDWSDDLITAFKKNPEIEEFVLYYPLKKDIEHKVDLSEYANSEKVPLLLQWDERWGYNQYAGELMGLSGCGPTCLSMVSIYLLNDATYTPDYIAEFAEENGYCTYKNGSEWTLISEGGEVLGLNITEIPLDENTIIQNLKNGNPIICAMGPGNFTSTGHFIVMTAYEDGKIKVNDPYSKLRSEKLWELSDITNQIRNLWVCKAKQ